MDTVFARSGPTLTVIKVGGSLFDLSDLGERLRNALTRLEVTAPLLVPGGGRFADEMRRLDEIYRWPQSISHRLGLWAMSLGARVLTGILQEVQIAASMSEAEAVLQSGGVPIVDASVWPGLDELPESWSVTSDSIAAAIAAQCAAPLVLMKSVSLSQPVPGVDQAASAGLVDEYFPIAAAPLGRIDWCNLRNPEAERVPWIRC